MAQMTCHECGKRYNYAIEESCPKCGAYNSPKSGSTQLEGDLLARSHAARSHQQRGQQPTSQPRQSTRTASTTSRYSTPQPTKKKTSPIITLLAILAIIIFFFNTIGAVIIAILSEFPL